MEDNMDLLVSFIRKYWDQFDSILQVVDFENTSYDDRKILFLKGLKLNLDKFETDEKWSDYVVGRVYRNRKKNYYEECIHWLLVTVYLVDMTTTKQSLYDLALKDIIEIRKDSQENL